MPQPIGYAFAPTTENAQERPRGGMDQSQRALQTLSFSLPTFAGAGRRKGLSPLQGQSFAGSPMSQAVLQSVLRTVLGPEAMGSFDQSSSDPAGVHGTGEVSPSWLDAFQGRPSRAPVIHPGGDGRLPGEGGSVSGEMFGAPAFTRPGGEGGGRAPGSYSTWTTDERGLGSDRLGYLPPDFASGSGYF